MIWLQTLSQDVGEMNQAFVFESIKTSPSASDITQIHPEDKPSGEEWFEVVPVLDSDCNLSPFWKKVCRNVQTSEVIYNPSAHRQMLVIRNISKADARWGLELVRAMIFLGEMPDFRYRGNISAKEAQRLEYATREVEAKRLTNSLKELLKK